jgi:hypothetical protein
MSFDISRLSFDPWKDFLGVVMQQGRVQLDSDWNEWLAELARRIQAGMLDTVGRSAVPSTTPNAFRIQPYQDSSGSNQLRIGAGRMYVDGLLVENHGPASAAGYPGAAGTSIPNWAASIPYSLGNLVIDPNGNVQCCTSAGTSGASTPQTWKTTLGQTTQDAGTLVWTLVTQWDQALAELSAAPAIAPMLVAPVPTEIDIDYTRQPYYSNPAQLAGNGPYLVYLDVWLRPVTYLEYADLVEKAVGIDTTGRLQTVWQVRALDVSGVAGGVSCSTPDSAIPAWQSLTQPSASRLTTGWVPLPTSGPCCRTPATGYTGMENQLYRVEIHQGGGANPSGATPNPSATFKWSRANASIITGVTAITTARSSANKQVSQLTVLSTGKDDVLSFQPGEWIELIDDFVEFSVDQGGRPIPGELHQIDAKGVDKSQNTIRLQDPVSSTFQNRFAGAVNYHARIIRWNQGGLGANGKVYQVDNKRNLTVYCDLDAVVGGIVQGSAGIPVPLPGTTLLLENGITVSFTLNPSAASGGSFVTRDFWVAAARAADGTVDKLKQAPPIGAHHYARLAVGTFPDHFSDCRIPWPPAPAQITCCGCTIMVQPSDLNANHTLQNVIDQYRNIAATTVICLAPGVYNMNAPLRFTPQHTNITLKSCVEGTATIQAAPRQQGLFADGLVVLDSVNNINLEGLRFAIPVTQVVAGFGAWTTSTIYSPGDRIVDSNNNIQVCAEGGVSGTQRPNWLTTATGLTPDGSAEWNWQGPAPFAGLPITSLDVSVQGLVLRVLASIGVRILGGTAINISKCEFNIGGENLRAEGFFFGAGIFATGQCQNIRVDQSRFMGLRTDSPRYFWAGILMAPSVALSSTAAVPSVTEPRAAGTIATRRVSSAPTRDRTVQAAVRQFILRRLSAPSSTPSPVPVVPPPILAGTTYSAAAGGTVLASSLTSANFNGNSFSFSTMGIILLASAGILEANRNQVDGFEYAGGLWLLTPLFSTLLLDEGEDITVMGLLVALGYPLPQGTTTQPTPIAAAPSTIRVYTGAHNYTDSQNQVWEPDVGFGGLTISGDTLPYHIPNILNPNPPAIKNTSDSTLYQSERFGMSFSYVFGGLPAGYYQVTLKFAEIFWDAAGTRVFSVSINNVQVLTNLDIFADAGGEYAADDKIFNNMAPDPGGNITITFEGGSTSPDHNAKISAIQIDPQWGIDAATIIGEGGPNVTGFADLYFQSLTLGQQAYAELTANPLQLRIAENEMQRLSTSAIQVLADDQMQNGKISSLMMTGNRLYNSQGTVATGFVSLLTRCVVSANMIVNEAAQDRVSFLLYDLPLPAPQVAVIGNLFQGEIDIEVGNSPATAPYPNPSDGQASPLKDWSYLNTQLL